MSRIRAFRSVVIAVMVLAMPAFAFFSFDALMRGTALVASTRAGIAPPAYVTAPPLGSRLSAAGERLRGVRTSAASPVRPEAPAPAALPEAVDVPVLVYHNIRPPRAKRLSPYEAVYDMTPEQFEAQMRYLRDGGYSPTSLAAVYRALSEGAPLPAKPVVITIDDGRDNQYAYAVPVLESLGFTATYFVFTNAIDREGYFTTEQLRALAGAGNEFCSHSRYHPYLTKSGDEDLVAEVAGSKKSLEEKLGTDVRCFGYPFGLSDERVQQAVRDAGYSFARGLRHGVVHRRDDLFDMKAHIVTGDISKFKALMERR